MSIININNVFSGKGTLYNGTISIIPPPEGVYFGNFCAIGPNLKIIGINHDYDYPALQYTFYKKYFNQFHPGRQKITKKYSKGKIVIGNDVWFGDDVTILSGGEIGDGCIIGASSIVTKKLEPYTICVGNPCKEIKKRYNDDIINFLLKCKWWNWDDNKIKNNQKFFNTNLNDHDVDYIKNIIV